MNKLFIRTLSSFVLFTIIGLFYFFFKHLGLVIFATLTSLIAFYEFENTFLKPIDSKKINRILFYTVSLCGFVLASIPHPMALSLFLMVFAIYNSIFIFSNRKKMTAPVATNYIGIANLGILFCVLGTGHLIQIIDSQPLDIILFFLGLTIAHDTLAYFGGFFWGRTPLHPHFSPKKTVEGSLTGLAGSLTLALAMGWYTKPENIFSFLLIGLACNIASQAGDLFESQLKRYSRQKDTGTLIPGHGGVLDRIDGLLFSAPIFFVLSSILL